MALHMFFLVVVQTYFIDITFLSLARIINISIAKLSRIAIYIKDQKEKKHFSIKLVHVFGFDIKKSSVISKSF